MKAANTGKTLRLSDDIGSLADNIAENWLIGLRETNPAILDMFHERDKKPYRDLLPWSGEFAGKYITGAYYIYKLTQNADLYRYILSFIDELITLIDTDGYAGCYQRESRLTGGSSQAPNVPGATWDAWSHYHIMMGLYLWFKQTGGKRLWESVLKIADLFINTFYHGGRRLVDIGFSEMNLAPIHIFAIIYKETKDEKYLNFAREIEKDTASPLAGDYMNYALKNFEFFECPKPRWESLHIIMGFAEMYLATGEEKYQKAATQIFYSILKTDVHNTGGFSTEEKAIGHPFMNGKIELCCVIAYNALACYILNLDCDVKILDFLEQSLYNAVAGSFSPTGRWSTYNTPMEGEKEANYHSIGFQCRPGSPELNCCSTNAARGVGMLSEWAVMEDENTTYINYFGAMSCVTADGIAINIESDYPAYGNIKIKITSQNKKRVAIRIPEWSYNSSLLFNGKKETPASGEYWVSDKKWDDDVIELALDFAPRFLEGGRTYKGKKSLFIGPILYGMDLAVGNDRFDMDNLAPINHADLMKLKPAKRKDGRITLTLSNGLILSDFYHLGSTGSKYITWFKFV